MMGSLFAFLALSTPVFVMQASPAIVRQTPDDAMLLPMSKIDRLFQPHQSPIPWAPLRSPEPVR